MRVLIVNTSERAGGAAVAANRLVAALNNNGVKAKMLVRDKETQNITVAGLNHLPFHLWHFLWERWCIFCQLHFSKNHLFEIDIANSGFDITTLREFKEADVIHLHWINQGMLSLKGIRKILDSGKPVVWTLHDFWAATGICHLTLGCRKFTSECFCCKYLPNGGASNDISNKVWKKKMKLFRNINHIHFVTCSHWLADEADQSALLKGQNITTIPNPIDTNLFKVNNREKARKKMNLPQDKRLICFISQRATNENKGISYLIEACDRLAAEHPDSINDTAIVILGSHANEFEGRFKYPVYPLGYLSDPDSVVSVYNSIDLFVLPSLSENLPNTIMEALACGVPCVGFKVGGIPEMIDHLKNGYVAEYKNAADLAKGIWWVLSEADHEELKHNALHKVLTNYSQQNVALKYIDVYNQAKKGFIKIK